MKTPFLRSSLYASVFLVSLLFTNFFTFPIASAVAPIPISDCLGLQAMTNNLAGNYVLANDIDCSDTVNWNGGAGFMPVGVWQGSEFSGTFDGQGHSITGLFINRPTTDFIGLFGAINNSTVQNVHLVSGSITGREVVGSLVGLMIGTSTVTDVTSNVAVTGGDMGNQTIQEGIGGLIGKAFGDVGNTITITDVSTSGAVSGMRRTGGLVGWLHRSNLSNAWSSGNVTATGDDVGGLVGWVESASISVSYAIGTVSGNDHTGGLVGSLDSNMSNTYASGDVVGNDQVGGLVGALTNGTISYSYATGDVTATGSAGGLIGESAALLQNSFSAGLILAGSAQGGLVGTNTGTITASFWYLQNSGPSECYDGGDTGCTSKGTSDHPPYFYLFANAPMSSWDFSTIWIQRPHNFPELRVFYALASVPTSLAGYANSSSSVTLNWSGNGASYVLSNDTLANTVAVSGTVKTIEGLQCGTDYSFRVKALNSDQVETVYSSSVNIQTSACPTSGGGAAFSAYPETSATPTISTPSQNSLLQIQTPFAPPIPNKLQQDIGIQAFLPFTDVKGHWSLPYIQKLYDMGIVQGKSRYLFEPDSRLTRAEMIKIILLTSKHTIIMEFSNLKKYSDIPMTAWYPAFIATAESAGILQNYAENTLEPNAPVTDREVVNLLFLALKKKPDGTFKKFDSNHYITRGEMAELAIKAYEF